MIMKSFLSLQLTIFSLLVLLMGCQKDKIDNPRDEYMNFGTITGIDMTLCMCCGGWFIEIDNATYRFKKLPDNCDINLYDETFPVFVILNWEEESYQCLGDEIIIRRIEKN